MLRFDPSNWAWTNLSSAPAAPPPRAFHSLTELGGQLYLFGGQGGPDETGGCFSGVSGTGEG